MGIRWDFGIFIPLPVAAEEQLQGLLPVTGAEGAGAQTWQRWDKPGTNLWELRLCCGITSGWDLCKGPEPLVLLDPLCCWILHGWISTPPGPIGSCQQLQTVQGWETPHRHPLNPIEGPRDAAGQHPGVCGTAWCGSGPDPGWAMAGHGNNRAGQDRVWRSLLNWICEGCGSQGDEFYSQTSTWWWEMSHRPPPQKSLLL